MIKNVKKGDEVYLYSRKKGIYYKGKIIVDTAYHYKIEYIKGGKEKYIYYSKLIPDLDRFIIFESKIDLMIFLYNKQMKRNNSLEEEYQKYVNKYPEYFI